MKSFLGKFDDSDRQQGLYLMGRFWDRFTQNDGFKNPAVRNAVNFNSMVAYYDRLEPSFISWLGSLRKQYGVENMRKSVVAAAAAAGTSYPLMSRFSYRANNDAINESATTMDNVFSAVSDTATEIGTGIVWASRLGLIVSVAFFLVIGLAYYKAFAKTLPK